MRAACRLTDLALNQRRRAGRLGAWLVGPAALLIALAAPAQASWQEDLAAQLRWDHNCQVSFYSGVTERLVNGQQVVIAKAHCEDGRVFDAIQRNELEEFEINECTPKEQSC
ncbi:MAG TPA: hypothetical protein VHQ91_09060 [Geminicoccaceae bacterium]|jgi:hypothetical protein|nr:hypothetical protein [Geminicoccaceae bacterium]